MKVLHLCSSYVQNPLYNELISRLEGEKISNSVFVPVGNTCTKQVPKNVNVCKCFNSLDKIIFSLKQLKIRKECLSYYDCSKFNLIHAHYLFTNGATALYIKKKYNVPYIVAVRNTDINVFFKYRINLRKIGINILLNSEKVILLSPKYIDQLMKYVPKKHKSIVKSKICIIPNGINQFWFDNLYKDKKKNIDKLKIVFAGTIDRNKNLIRTSKAIENLEKKGYDVIYNVAGKICSKRIFKKLSKRSFFKYYGKLEKEELINVYRDSDVFVMPSIYETFGLVYAESLSQSLPLIYTKNQGFDGQFDEGYVGYHVNAKNVDSIEQGIISVINNYDEIIKNTQKAVKIFNWDNIAEQYMKIYTDIGDGNQ